MRRNLASATLAALLSGPAVADVPPSLPEPTLDAACAPLLGIWQRTTPRNSRFDSVWTLLMVDSAQVTRLTYNDLANGQYYEARSDIYGLRCTSAAGGKLDVEFLARPGDPSGWIMQVAFQGATFTTTEQTTYDRRGPPDPDWKPETYTVTYRKLLP